MNYADTIVDVSYPAIFPKMTTIPSFKITIARPVTKTIKAQAQGRFVAPARVQQILYQKRLRNVLDSYNNSTLPSTNIFKIVMIEKYILPLLSWPGKSLSVLRGRTKYPFLFATSQTILYFAALLSMTKATLFLTPLVALAALHIDKISSPMEKLVHTAHALLARLEIFLSNLSARSNTPRIRAYIDNYLDTLLTSLEQQIGAADTNDRILGDKCSSADDPPQSKQLVPICVNTRICLEPSGDVKSQNVWKTIPGRLDGVYPEFDEEGWLLLPNSEPDSQTKP